MFFFGSPGDEKQGVYVFDKLPKIHYFIGPSTVYFFLLQTHCLSKMTLPFVFHSKVWKKYQTVEMGVQFTFPVDCSSLNFI